MMSTSTTADTDRFEANNLIWQLDVTLKKLSEIAKRNGRLVDHISKEVNNKVIDFNAGKDSFKKLTWAEMDDSDLELDLDIPLPSVPINHTLTGEPILLSEGEQHVQDDKHKAIDDKAANPDPLHKNGSKIPPSPPLNNTTKHNKEGLSENEQYQTMAALINITIKESASKKTKIQQKLAKRKKKLEQTHKSELEMAEKKKQERLERNKRAEQRKEEFNRMLKQKNIALSNKLNEIKANDHMQKENAINAIKQKQIKAEIQQQRILNMKKFPMLKLDEKLRSFEKENEIKTKEIEDNLNKRLQNAANKREKMRRNSLISTASPITDDFVSMSTCDVEDEAKYFDMAHYERLSAMFCNIPRIVRKSSSSNLYIRIEALYKNTNKFDKAKVEKALKIWFESTNCITFGQRKHDKDALLVINRLTCFNLSKLEMNCATLLVQNLLLLTKNKKGLDLLIFKYSLILMMYYQQCLNAFVFESDESFKGILPQIGALLSRMFESALAYAKNDRGGDKEYKKFRKQTVSLLLLNLFKSSLMNTMATIFK